MTAREAHRIARCSAGLMASVQMIADETGRSVIWVLEHLNLVRISRELTGGTNVFNAYVHEYQKAHPKPAEDIANDIPKSKLWLFAFVLIFPANLLSQ